MYTLFPYPLKYARLLFILFVPEGTILFVLSLTKNMLER